MRRRSRVAVLVMVAAVALALLVTPAVVGIAGGGSGPSSPASPSSGAAPSTSDEAGMVAIERRDPDDPLALGRVDAPVVMVLYCDFQSPHCARWDRDTAPAMMPFVEDGTLRIEWRDFPYLGQESVTAAVAARAAGQQGAFWEYHDALFADRRADFTERHLVGMADGLGLDTQAFRAAMADPETLRAVRADFDQGQTIGVNVTPAFLVNGEPLLGAQPTTVFVEAVEKAAAAAR